MMSFKMIVQCVLSGKLHRKPDDPTRSFRQHQLRMIK